MSACELCHHAVKELTTRPLVARTRHTKKQSKKGVTRAGTKSRRIVLCRPCHNRVHMLLNK